MGALSETLLRDEDCTETARPHTGHGATRRPGSTRTPHPRPKATGELTQLTASGPGIWVGVVSVLQGAVDAGERRGNAWLDPFGAELANKLFEAHPSAHTRAINMCMASLLDFYVLLRVSEWHAQNCRWCVPPMLRAIQGVELRFHRNGHPLYWKQKPKMHLFQELSKYQSFDQGNPSTFWTYQDEDFAGIIAEIAASRGGPKKSATLALNVLQRYRGFCSH